MAKRNTEKKEIKLLDIMVKNDCKDRSVDGIDPSLWLLGIEGLSRCGVERARPVLAGVGCGCERQSVGRGRGERNACGFLSSAMLFWMVKPLNAERMTVSWEGVSR